MPRGVFPHKLLCWVDTEVEDLNIARGGGVFPQKLLNFLDDKQETQMGGIPNNQFNFEDLENQPGEVEQLRKNFE